MRRRPALFHQIQQMLQGVFVSPAFLFGQLLRTLVQLRGHFRGFFRRTAECNQNFCEFGNLHKSFHCIGGNDFDADDADAFERFAVFTGTARTDRRIGNFIEHVVAFDQMAERGVLMVKK